MLKMVDPNRFVFPQVEGLKQERQRQQALNSYTILDTRPEVEYDAITQIASQICQTPIAQITFLDHQRQWIKSSYGIQLEQTPRELSFCTHAIQTPQELMQVPDARLDKRFAHNPMTTGEPYVVFYAGVPLVDQDGQALGTLCVIDHQPRHLSQQQTTTLKALARQVVALLHLRKSQRLLAEANQQLRQRNHVLQLESREAELALQQQERQYGLLVDNLKEVVYQTDLTGHWTFLNPYWHTATGLLIQESLGQPFYGQLEARYHGQLHRRFEDLLAKRRESFRYTVPYYHQNGSRRWAEVFCQLLEDEEGRPIGTTGTIADITERKAALDALFESNLQFQEFAEHVNDVIFIHSADPVQLVYINPAYERIWGLSCQSLYDDPASAAQAVLKEDQNQARAALQLYQEGEPNSVQYRIRKPDGSVRWIHSRTFVIRARNGKAVRYIGIASDITDQKEKELVLQQALQREQELNKLKSHFVATVSHEFRTPLATIQSSVDLIRLYLERSGQAVQPAISRHLTVIQREIIDFDDLLKDVLTVEKMDAGKMVCLPKLMNVRALIDQVISTHFSERPDGRSVELTQSGQPQTVELDEKLITHVLVNLLSNAFKFSSTNPQVHITFDHQLSLAIVDRGIGIPPDDLPHLFETFFRAGNAATFSGTGLGLVIARQFVELQGGTLEVISQQDKGTTFTIRFPLS